MPVSRKKAASRRWYWSIILFLLGSVLLSACGDSATATSVSTTVATATTAAASSTTSSATTSSTTAAAGATTAAATSATTAASNAVDVSKLPQVELTYIYPGTVPKDVQSVQDAMNVILKQKLNATIKLVPVDWGAFDQKMKLSSAAGEKYDLAFTATWTNNYYQNVANGNFVPLDDLITKYAPKLYASLPKSYWEAARVNGKIYGAINQQIFAPPWGVSIRKDLAEKYKLDLNTINTYQDLQPFFEQIKKNEPGVTPILSDDQYNGAINFNLFDNVDGGTGVASIKPDDQTLKAFLYQETPEYKQAVTLARTWYQAGYYTKDLTPASDATAAFKAGKYAAILHVVKPGGDLEYKAQLGYETVSKGVTKSLMTTGGPTATMTAISRTSANPERAMMLLELLNSDQQLYNILAKGVEGKHWVWDDQAQKVIKFPDGITSETSGYNPNTDWMFGNQFNAYYVNKLQVGAWEGQAKVNSDAIVSSAMGFNFIPDKVKTEIAQVQSVVKQYGGPLEKGLTDPASALPEYISKLKAAGADKIVAEVQSQLDDWKKTR